MILILGGTGEAQALAARLAGTGTPALVSLAGRTQAPALAPLPTRVGGFGGAEGLAGFLRERHVTAVVDATHPFAAAMSAHAVEACRLAAVPLLVLGRRPWTAGPGDRWTEVTDGAGAVAALGAPPRRVFLTAGRLELPAFLAAPQHHYLIRTIDPPERLPPRCETVLARGPFTQDGERALMEAHRIEVLISKNSGGGATAAKLAAARALGLPVILLRRPPASGAHHVWDVEAALAWCHGRASQTRGV